MQRMLNPVLNSIGVHLENGRILYIVYLIVLPVVFIIMEIIILVCRNRK